jgi:hypothetical protein
MIYTHSDLLKLIHDTKAVSIWNRANGPVFWYAANIPGPFYVNTEQVIGGGIADHLLREITAIVAGTADAPSRAAQLEKLIMPAFLASSSWQRLIATMAARARDIFGHDGFTLVSGGERRDWLFSIPFAHACDLPHLFLFKNLSTYCAKPLPQKKATLHVSDLINNAASFFDLWQPILKREKIDCVGNLCVNIRGDAGAKRLRDAGVKTTCLVTIDTNFFRNLRNEKLIDQATSEEIAVFFASDRDWAVTYLIGNPALFDAAGCDAKSFERLRAFIANDPWKLRPAHEAFFAAMQAAIDQRAAKAA